MIAPAKVSTASVPNIADPHETATCQNHFLRLLPSLHRQIRYRLRHLATEAREEAVQEALSIAWAMYARLVELGRVGSAHAMSLSRYAVARIRDGRTLVGGMNRQDVMSEYCRRRRGVYVERLDRFANSCCTWKEVLVEDHTATPADLAAIRIDFPAWLDSLPSRTRRIAEALATSARTRQVARQFGISAGRVSQLRKELKGSWERFQTDHEEVRTASARPV